MKNYRGFLKLAITALFAMLFLVSSAAICPELQAATWTDYSSFYYGMSGWVGAPDGTVWSLNGYRSSGQWYYTVAKWTNSGGSYLVNWSTNLGYNSEGLNITIDKNGTPWVYAGGSLWSNSQNCKVWKYDGFQFTVVKDFDAPAGGKIVTGPNGLWVSYGGALYETRDNGSTWISRGSAPGSLFVGPDGEVWAGNNSGQIYRWDGSNWTLMTTNISGISNKSGSSFLTAGKGIWHRYYETIWIYQYTRFSYWDGSTWTDYGQAPNASGNSGATIAPDGSLWISWYDNFSGGTYRWNGSAWETTGSGSGSSNWRIESIGNANGGIWTEGMNSYGVHRYGDISYPSTSGASSISETAVSVNIGTGFYNAVVEVWKDGQLVAYDGGPGPVIAVNGLTPGTQYQVRAGLRDSTTGLFKGGSFFNVQTIPATPAIVDVTLQRVVWSNSVGRGKVALTWGVSPGATGYKVWVSDGNQYRSFDVGNVTTWDSSAARIYPDPNWLSSQADNSISTDPLNHAGGGFDLQDNPNLLYRKTVGVVNDGASNYWFKVSAYNATGESPLSTPTTVTLPNATDSILPIGAVSVLAQDGLKKTYEKIVNVTVDVSDDLGGIRRIELSNDGVTYTSKQEAILNADNSTGVVTYSHTWAWDLPLGAGTKVVYVRVTDGVGNQRILTDTIAMAEDMMPPSITLLINNGDESTTNPNVALIINVNDNVSIHNQFQMRFSNDGQTFSPWNRLVISRLGISRTSVLAAIPIQALKKST